MSTRKGEPVASHSTKDTQQTNLGSTVPRRPRHSAIAYTIRHRARMVIACLIAGVLVFVGTVAAATWFNIDHAVQERSVNSLIEHQEYLDPNAGQPIRFVLIGQDSRDAGNADNLVERHTHIDRLQVVDPRAFDLYRFRDVLHACLQDSSGPLRISRIYDAGQACYSSQALISAVWG